MKYIKWYAIGLLVLMVLLYVARSELLIKKYKKISASVMVEEIIEDNIVDLPAIIENDNIELQIAKNETIRVIEFKYVYADPPESDDDINDVNTFVDFLPDESIDILTILDNDSRKALTHYKYSDALNDYSMTLKIKYDYKHETFEITPHDLDFELQKAFPFCISAVLNNSSCGLNLSWDFWRFRVGSGIYVTKDINPIVGISVGWRF